MQKIVILIATLLTTIINGQSEFDQQMMEARSFRTNDATRAIQIYETLGKSNAHNWLPLYYASELLITGSCELQDKALLKSNLDRAEALLKAAEQRSPNNPEILVMRAIMLTAWVNFDGAYYGMLYAQEISRLYQSAMLLAPDNPRVVLNKARWDMGMASFFGRDPKVHCSDVAYAKELFVTFKPESDLHPSWGKDQAEAILKTCN